MDMNVGQAYYAKQCNAYILKLAGDVRYTLGRSLDTFLSDLFARDDYDDILVDLTDAQCIDSTSLGLLAKIANFVRNRFSKKATLISTNVNINQILDSVGFYDIFTVCDNCPLLAEAAQQLPLTEPSKAELTQTLFEAHNLLSELNDNNREMFKGVVDNLRTKLAIRQE